MILLALFFHDVWQLFLFGNHSFRAVYATLRRGSHPLFISLEAKAGGADRVRTCDPHNAIVVLYQLSYDPIQSSRNLKSPPRLSKLFATRKRIMIE